MVITYTTKTKDRLGIKTKVIYTPAKQFYTPYYQCSHCKSVSPVENIIYSENGDICPFCRKHETCSPFWPGLTFVVTERYKINLTKENAV